jgi:pimeloyl-ACP methyl ester carboxylesterase
MRHLILLLHGILTRRTSESWPKHFSGYVASLPDVATEAIYYEAGPIAWWNTLVRNPRLARDLAGRVETRHRYETRRVHLVAHSNGADIAVRAMRRLAEAGIRVETAILTGAAIESDIERSGLAALVGDGHLGRAIAYCSPSDGVVRRLEILPGGYGALGAKGFRRGGKPIGLQLDGYQTIADLPDWGMDRFRYVTRRFENFGHGEYFDPAERRRCFDAIISDLGIEDPRI